MKFFTFGNKILAIKIGKDEESFSAISGTQKNIVILTERRIDRRID
jgi:hypothetical protein